MCTHVYPIFNRFVINKLSFNIISHVGARYNCKKTELGIWDNGVINVGYIAESWLWDNGFIVVG